MDNGLPGRSLIRRLSNVEYDATIKTLFNDPTDYAASFPTDSVVNGFTNNTDVQDVGPALAEQFLAVAEKIATSAVKNPDALLGCPTVQAEAHVNQNSTDSDDDHGDGRGTCDVPANTVLPDLHGGVSVV